METPHGTQHAFLPLIFISSFCALAYEMALVRIFSITLWYHFAFMVVSIAMLGIGASGTLLSILPVLKDSRRIPAYVLLLALAIPASYLASGLVPFDPARLSWDWMQVLFIGSYAVILSTPFLFFGLTVSTAFASLPAATGAIYASDLLGAGFGSLAVFGLLYTGGPETTVFILSILAAAAVLVPPVGTRSVRFGAALLLGFDVLLLLLRPAFVQPVMSPYKPLQLALKYPGARLLDTHYSPYSRVDLFESPAVRFAPGLSLKYLLPLPHQIGVAVDGGDIHAITDARDKGRLDFIDHLPSVLPYVLARPKDVLVLEPKGGLPVLTAVRSGARRIFTVESNPLMQRVVRERAEIIAPHAVEFHHLTGLGRSRIAGLGRMFDLIHISSLGSLTSGPFGFAEDYRYTVESFIRYLECLKPAGMVSVDLYLLPPARSEFRLLATVLQAAEEAGISGAELRTSAIRSWDTVTILFKKSALSRSEINGIKKFCAKNRFDTVYYPGMEPGEGNRFIKMPGNEYAEAFGKIINQATRPRFIRGYLFDIRPVRDARPFAHYYLKREKIKDIYRVMGRKWQFFFEEGYLLPLLFLQVLVVSMVVMLLPLITLRRTGRSPASAGAVRSLPYFAALGLGYLFIEISFMQSMILPLEHPAYAAGTVVASVLMGSGLGGYLGQRIAVLRRPGVLVWLSTVIILYALVLPSAMTALGLLPMIIRVVAGFLILMPAGLLMGIPFPLGISLLGNRDPDLIPWAWAVNGSCSVISPVLAVMIALSAGFTVVILCGAGLYLVGFLLVKQLVVRGS